MPRRKMSEKEKKVKVGFCISPEVRDLMQRKKLNYSRVVNEAIRIAALGEKGTLRKMLKYRREIVRLKNLLKNVTQSVGAEP